VGAISNFEWVCWKDCVVCDIELRVNMLTALCWVRYRNVRGYVAIFSKRYCTAIGLVSSCVLRVILNCDFTCYQQLVACDIDLEVDMLAGMCCVRY